MANSDQRVSIRLRVVGICPNGHEVVKDAVIRVPVGDEGFVKQEAGCGGCGQLVLLSAGYRAPRSTQ